MFARVYTWGGGAARTASQRGGWVQRKSGPREEVARPISESREKMHIPVGTIVSGHLRTLATTVYLSFLSPLL